MGYQFDKLDAKEQIVLNTFLETFNYSETGRQVFPQQTQQAHYDSVKTVLDRDHVKLAMAERLNEIAKKTDISVAAVLEELATIGFSNILDFVKWTETKVELIASNEIDYKKAAAISEVRQTKDGLVIKMHNKNDALEKIGKHLLMFVERKIVDHHHSGEVQHTKVIESLDFEGIMNAVKKQGLVLESAGAEDVDEVAEDHEIDIEGGETPLGFMR